ncbi:MAG: CU044_2847 family protein [Waterburya sp.]
MLRVNQVKIFWSYLCLLKVVFFLHFNLNFAKSCGIPYVTEGSAESHLKITVECSFPEQSHSPQ